jgi:hypothetical protein
MAISTGPCDAADPTNLVYNVRTFLNSSAHSAIDIFWIERAWPDGAEDCVCAKRARHAPDTRATPNARLGRRRSILGGA